MKHLNANNSKILLLFLLITVSYFFIDKIDDIATQYYDNALENASIAFLMARSLNAIISIAQSLTITPLVGELQIGEILDPVNDMIERFSWVMLAVTIVIGIQKLLLEIGVTINYVYPLIIAFILFAISFQCANKTKLFLYVLVRNILLLVFFIRFLIPIYGYICNEVSNNFLNEKVEHSIERIKWSQQKIEELETIGFIKNTKNSLHEVKLHGGYIIDYIITLMTIFLLEMILLPLIFLFFINKFVFGLRI